ncbi:MAG: hypothetical protein JXR97_01165 [Planctomycetes bacterium]|nr:hypothetical protein [Planctomycetota bacterium]
MKAYTYENTLTNIPRFDDTLHVSQKYGYGYETDTHFVHLYGKEELFIISNGLTVLEGKNGTHFDWIKNRFGATNIEEMELEAGNTIEGIWRPALYNFDDTDKGININNSELRSQEQALRVLIEKLDEILLYIEPSSEGLESYSHKIRELLILAATEVENQWRVLLNRANEKPINGSTFTTQDYVKTLPFTFVEEFEVSLKHYSLFKPAKPFSGWNSANPTKSLKWYDSYNKTKHNRDRHFDEAKLKYAIDAVAANIALYCTRFGILRLLHDTTILTGLFKQIFDISMVNSDRKTFYIPELEIPKNTRKNCFVFDCYLSKYNKPWTLNKLKL